MSDCAGSRIDKEEEIQILFTKSDPIEPPQHKNYLWMARWTKASTSAEPQNSTSCNRMEDRNKGSGKSDSGILTSEFMKSTIAERLMVGVNHEITKELGPKNYRHGDQPFERYTKQKAVNLHAKAVVSETCSLRKLSEVPLDLQKLGSSDVQGSVWNHFPMFEINRKMSNILNPRRRSALGPVSLDVNIAHEYMVHSRRIIQENIDIHKPAGGIASHPKDPAGVSSDPAGKKLKGHLLDTMSCSCIQDNDSANYYFANSNHELPFVSSGKNIHFAGNEKDQSDVSTLHNQKSRRPNVYKQEAVGDIFRAPEVGPEFRAEPITCSYKSENDGEDFDGTFESHGKAISSLPYEQQHLKTQRTEPAANLNLHDPGSNTVTVTSKQRAHGKDPAQKSSGSCKPKGLCLYEMLTIAPKSQNACPRNSVSSGNGIDVCMYGTNFGSHLFGTQNQSSARTETLNSDTVILSKSSAGMISSPAQKDYAYSSDAKTERLATPSTRRDSDSKEKESHNVNEHRGVSSRGATASKQFFMPAPGSTNLDLLLFRMSRMRNPISVGIVQPPVSAEPSDRWLKRLHLEVPDHETPSSKRAKVGGSPSLEDSCLFGTAHGCNRRGNEESIDRVEDKVSDEKIVLREDPNLHVPAKSVNYWVGRWCEGGTPVFHGGPGQRRQGTKSDRQASEELGVQFPSIAAMAMMGRVMNKLRPCEHQKKGPLVVWKTK